MQNKLLRGSTKVCGISTINFINNRAPQPEIPAWGFTLLKALQKDDISALDNGTTDYLTKLFRNGELLARIRVAIRKDQNVGNATLIVTGNLEIDLEARIEKSNGELVKLTASEYSLLALFAKNEARP